MERGTRTEADRGHVSDRHHPSETDQVMNLEMETGIAPPVARITIPVAPTVSSVVPKNPRAEAKVPAAAVAEGPAAAEATVRSRRSWSRDVIPGW